MGACGCMCAYITDNLMISFTVWNSWCHFFFSWGKENKNWERDSPGVSWFRDRSPSWPRSFRHGESHLSWLRGLSRAITHWCPGVRLLLALSPQASLAQTEPLFCSGCLARSHLPPVTLSISSGCKSILSVPGDHEPVPCWLLAFWFLLHLLWSELSDST